MSQKMFRIIIALAALLHLTLANYYQVEILLELQPGITTHSCNGAIIYEKLIITTANCVHFKLGAKGKPIKLDPSVLSVVAGSTNAFIDALRVNVSAIDIAKNFNPYTLENDLALLTLSHSLPLGTRPDMKWIMLDDNIHANHSCLANFFSRNSKHAVPSYYQTEELTMYNNEICRNFTDHPKARKDDICSIYVLPQQLDCAAADSFLAYNTDRGTGLVCKSYLVGLLSTVVSRPSPKNNCSDVTLAAIYTNIFPHLMWVYSIMANIETEYTSTPYEASLKAMVINTTNDKEYLTTTLVPPTTVNVTNSLNSTITTNSTITNPISLNSTTTNSTTWNHTLTNSTGTNSTLTNSTTANPLTTNSSTWNHTITNSTTANSTFTNSTTVNPLSVNSTAVNSTVGNSSAVNSTGVISTEVNSTGVNSTTWNNPTTNSTVRNSREGNSTTSKNSTAVNSPTWNPISLNSTKYNSTAHNSTSPNTTTRAPPTTYPTLRFIPKTEPAIPDSYIKDPPPTVRNFFKNSSTSVKFSAGCLLIAFVSLRLINIYH